MSSDHDVAFGQVASYLSDVDELFVEDAGVRLDGKGPSEIGLDKLEKHLVNKNIKELILATNTTIEGEATAHYIKDMTSKKGINVSRLAFGLPLNGEIGFLDNETISHAFNERKII